MKKILCIILFYIICTISQTLASNEELLFIFDSSVSMRDNFYGTPKYEIAIREVKSMLDKLDSSQKVGLRTIGITVDATILNYLQNPEGMCKATQLTVPIRSNSIDYIKSSLDNIFPLGTTPLEYTLNLSINSDFTRGNNLKHIVLITDGADSCGGDPCRYARATMMQRSDIKIDIIAIGVNDEEVQQLKCIAEATKGQLFISSNPKDVAKAFNSIYSNMRTNTINTQYNEITTSPVRQEIQNINSLPNNAIKYKIYNFEMYD